MVSVVIHIVAARHIRIAACHQARPHRRAHLERVVVDERHARVDQLVDGRCARQAAVAQLPRRTQVVHAQVVRHDLDDVRQLRGARGGRSGGDEQRGHRRSRPPSHPRSARLIYLRVNSGDYLKNSREVKLMYRGRRRSRRGGRCVSSRSSRFIDFRMNRRDYFRNSQQGFVDALHLLAAPQEAAVCRGICLRVNSRDYLRTSQQGSLCRSTLQRAEIVVQVRPVLGLLLPQHSWRQPLPLLERRSVVLNSRDYLRNPQQGSITFGAATSYLTTKGIRNQQRGTRKECTAGILI